MAQHGESRPPRPRIELLTEPGSETEAAAIVAALEQFIADTAPPEHRQGPEPSPWQRAALREGVSRSEAIALEVRSE